MAQTVTFDADGSIRFIYNDAVAEIAREMGEVTIRRASHVEPTEDGQWTADMAPVGGPVLGPFASRAYALLEERDWLVDNDVPIPMEGR